MKTVARGRVILVGAGPGDPELLTLKGAKAIASADVVLVDDLVHDDVLAHARSDARIVYVGKRGGCVSTPQAFIERLMVNEARAGRRVVRLKGGDPFMFGRGGEEKTHLEAQGIAVEVVHGVTAGIAAPGAIGVPVTHREVTPGCIFITGHEKRGGPPIDWRAVAATRLTLVVYMGVARVAHIRDELLAGGLAADLPAVVIRNASLPDQHALATTLGQLPQDIEAHAIKSPAIMVIGDVAKFADLAAAPARRRVHGFAAPGDRVFRPAD